MQKDFIAEKNMVEESSGKKELCFLMPIYPPHYNYAKYFIKSYFHFNYDKQADLAFVFSNDSDKEKFYRVNGSGFFREVVVSDEVLRESNGVINVKKMYALHELKNEYTFIIVFDAESIFVKELDVLALCQRFHEEKILYGNKTIADPKWIYDSSKKMLEGYMDLSDSVNLRLYTELYTWYNQPCIYNTEYLKDFFEITKIHERYNELSVGSFDYMVFVLYLIVNQNYKIVDIGATSFWSFLESKHFSAHNDNYKHIRFYQCHPLLQDKLNNECLFLNMHLDRVAYDENGILSLRDDIFYYMVAECFILNTSFFNLLSFKIENLNFNNYLACFKSILDCYFFLKTPLLDSYHKMTTGGGGGGKPFVK